MIFEEALILLFGVLALLVLMFMCILEMSLYAVLIYTAYTLVIGAMKFIRKYIENKRRK